MKKLINILFVIICCFAANYANAQQPVRRTCDNTELEFTVTHSDVMCDGTESTAAVNIVHGGGGNNNVFSLNGQQALFRRLFQYTVRVLIL